MCFFVFLCGFYNVWLYADLAQMRSLLHISPPLQCDRQLLVADPSDLTGKPFNKGTFLRVSFGTFDNFRNSSCFGHCRTNKHMHERVSKRASQRASEERNKWANKLTNTLQTTWWPHAAMRINPDPSGQGVLLRTLSLIPCGHDLYCVCICLLWSSSTISMYINQLHFK